MKPQNKYQRQVVEASKSLPQLTDKQIQWGYDNVIEYIGQRTEKGVITCTRCGHRWQGEGELINALLGCDCPNCRTKLTVKTTRKRVFGDCNYMTIVTAHGGYQVVRTLMMKVYAKVGQPIRYSHSEVMQRWVAINGKYCTLAKLRQMGTGYYDSWIFHSDMELRGENADNRYYMNVYDRIPIGEIYPRIKLIPELKGTGLTKCFYGQRPFELFRALFTNNKFETLLKTHQIPLLKCFANDSNRNIDDCWASIRICIRNGYIVKDAALWLDYLDFLRYLGKDLHNAKYVCPSDLKAQHDRYMDKVATHRTRHEQQEDPQEYKSKIVRYVIAKGRYFGLHFSDGQIDVRVLNSVDEIVSEGKAMHHCVGSYHEKADSLILSATIGGKRIETVEVSLTKLRVIQCRGVCNGETPYHNQILDLVGRNMHQIEQRQTA